MRPTSCGRSRRPARSAAAPFADVLAGVSHVLARGDGSRDLDLSRQFGRIFGRHDRIERAGTGAPVMMRIAALTGHGAEWLARHRLAEHRERERVVFACPGRLRATQRIAVHRRAIESRHVERRDDVGGEDPARGLLGRNVSASKRGRVVQSTRGPRALRFVARSRACSRRLRGPDRFASSFLIVAIDLRPAVVILWDCDKPGSLNAAPRLVQVPDAKGQTRRQRAHWARTPCPPVPATELLAGGGGGGGGVENSM